MIPVCIITIVFLSGLLLLFSPCTFSTPDERKRLPPSPSVRRPCIEPKRIRTKIENVSSSERGRFGRTRKVSTSIRRQ